jgi:plasmid stabilization system protein ParE
MAFKLIYNDKALIDLENIFEWSREYHPDTTERFGEELFNHLELLTSFPHLAPRARERSNVRLLSHPPLLVLYRVHEKQNLIEILSFRHPKRRRLRF